MDTPAATSQVDIGEAFGFVFRSRNWFGKLAVGALCLFFFWLFLIPLFILLGYFIETARHISHGGRELPPWNQIGKKLGEGFLLSVALFVWELPGTLLSSGGGLQCSGSYCTYHPGALAGLGALYGLLIGLLTAAIWSQFLSGGFSGAFDFRAVFRRASMYPGMTVIVWLIASVVGTLIALAGLILVGIGILFTLPYAFALSANLYGQFRQRTQSVVYETIPRGQPGATT